MKRLPVERVSEFPAGERRILKIGRRSIGIFNADGRYYAVLNNCPHHGAPLCLGSIEGTMLPSQPHDYVYGREGRILKCPWHGYEFDLETGRSIYDEKKGLRVKIYRVVVEDDWVVLYH